MVIGLSGVQSVCNLTGDLTKSDDLVAGVPFVWSRWNWTTQSSVTNLSKVLQNL